MNLVMKASLGDDYLDCFDMCIANAKKPLFFNGGSPFYELNLQTKDFKGVKYDNDNHLSDNMSK